MEIETTLTDASDRENDCSGGIYQGGGLREGIGVGHSLAGDSLEHRACANLRALVEDLTAQLKIKDQELALADMTIEDMRREIIHLEEVAERRLGPTWE